MKATVAILVFSLCALAQHKAAIAAAEAACGPRDAKFEVQADASQHPTPAPEDGKALIYVVQEDPITTMFAVDGKWVGAGRGRTYFFVPIDPGEHHLCSQSGSGGIGTQVFLHQLKAEAGTTYYFAKGNVGFHPWFGISEVDPDEGKDLVARARHAVSHPK